MINKLIGALLAIVIGLAMLPVVLNVVDDLVGVGGELPAAVEALVTLLPILYVVIIVAGAVSYVAISGKR